MNHDQNQHFIAEIQNTNMPVETIKAFTITKLIELVGEKNEDHNPYKVFQVEKDGSRSDEFSMDKIQYELDWEKTFESKYNPPN